MAKNYFYAPDKNTHNLFPQETKQLVGIANARRNESGNFISWIVTTYFHVNFSVG